MWGLAVFLSAQAAVSMWLPRGHPGNGGRGAGLQPGQLVRDNGWRLQGRKGGADEHMEQARGGSPSNGDFRVKIQEMKKTKTSR